MADLPELSGPPQTGRGVKGQYVYWITMSHPRSETVEAHGVKVPGDFDRRSFRELLVEVHGECGVKIVETASFQELHENGLIHHNLLVRSGDQFKWRPVAEKLRNEHRVYVSYGSNIRTWAEGVVYGRVGSDHKGPEMLDKASEQWAGNGQPMRFEEISLRSGKQRDSKGRLR